MVKCGHQAGHEGCALRTRCSASGETRPATRRVIWPSIILRRKYYQLTPASARNVNRYSGMKATKCISLSANPRAVGLQSSQRDTHRAPQASAIVRLVVSLSAVLASGCQTFNMSPEKFAEQQRGHYALHTGSEDCGSCGCLLYFLLRVQDAACPILHRNDNGFGHGRLRPSG